MSTYSDYLGIDVSKLTLDVMNIEDKQTLLKEISRVLKPGGKFTYFETSRIKKKI